MDQLTLIGVCFAVLVVVLTSLIYFRSRQGQKTGAKRRPQQLPQNQDHAPPVRGAQGRRRPRMARANVQEQPEEDEAQPVGIAQEDREDLEEAGIKVPDGKIGKKKLEKLQMKAEKKRIREAEEEMRKEENRLKAEKEEKEANERAKEEELEQKRLEAEKREREEQERREHEEYLRMKAAFAIEEEGYDDEDGDADEENKLQAFIDYIQKTKVVLLEDLAAHFKMKTQDAISRVNELQEDGRLTGVVDDRGKFIYVSKDELEAVAKFIHQRGRVSIAELAESSNKLINLQPEQATASAT